ncbi:hypothetical protein SAMN05660690_2944 [Geodermatophilus telluris]|uniref:Uncharacterized protein n=1 Tax=Geodermatophilus telluris TaxID=1190417 RepID=A0A1G6QIG5_9ACTN|nr:hypothetical protein SAMN05660690_2944 [Geodermatophilus telluris]
MPVSASRLATVLGFAIASLVATAPSALAAPSLNDHNCAGTVVSSLAEPGFGPFVASSAQAQAVDNFGLANCGQPPRNNP